MVDTSPTLQERMCIDISINNQCNGSANLFHAQLQYAEGYCNNDTVFLETNKTFNPLYEICIPVLDPENELICFAIIILNANTQAKVGQTQKQQLVLLQCNSSDLFQGSSELVRVNSSDGEIEPGTSVPHNTVVQLSCSSGDFVGDVNKTRCVNGTFDPVVTNAIQCLPSGKTNVLKVL